MDLVILVKAGVAFALGAALLWIAISRKLNEIFSKAIILVSVCWSVIVAIWVAALFFLWMFDFTELRDTILLGASLTSVPVFILMSLLTGMAACLWINVWKDSRSRG
ncbi:MAG TPA: hypothetical protein PKH78_02470 [Candidatus Obscuribacter sp.]|nr:hypothetical protein [Candidatus Obscuribacter sp.]MBL8085654.1 hypothetical protein [Candidatus Obscuribacter sp.]HMW91268.1 hypothetical protein [Candidatus Obscuribacter sp.]HND66074.1 hypothetical protein [Candidatus Obscuribacter sp.]HNN61872.1 hypothetical protein [Candidatus Obscuribacter sp.]